MSIHTIRMPDIGEGIAEVEIVEWRVAVGDSVAEDQTLCDVMTDKSAVEVPSPVTGHVLELGGAVGQVMAVGSMLIRIEDGVGAVQAAAPPAAAAPAAAVPTPPAPPSAPVPPPPPAAAPAPRRRLRRPHAHWPRRPCASAPAFWASTSRA